MGAEQRGRTARRREPTVFSWVDGLVRTEPLKTALKRQQRGINSENNVGSFFYSVLVCDLDQVKLVNVCVLVFRVSCLAVSKANSGGTNYTHHHRSEPTAANLRRFLFLCQKLAANMTTTSNSFKKLCKVVACSFGRDTLASIE